MLSIVGTRRIIIYSESLNLKVKMCKFYLLIFFIIGANCDCIPPIVKKEISESYHLNNDILNHLINLTTDIQTSSKSSSATVADMLLQKSIDQLIESVAENKKYVRDLFARNLREMQKKLDRTEQIMHQKFVHISEDLQKSTLNMDKLQTSVKKLRGTVNANKKFMKEEYNKTSSVLKKLEHKLDLIQKNVLQFNKPISADDCSDLYNLGKNVSTSYFLPKYNKEVLCDMETDGGGWLLIQQRKKVTKQVDFNRNWASYKDGFGDLDTEFWIGNEFLHRITNQKSYELRIEMVDLKNKTFYNTHSKIIVGNEASGYTLGLEGYKGNVWNYNLRYYKNQKFSTFDRDNDKDDDRNCAQEHSGGFWFHRCSNNEYETVVNFNGRFPTDPETENKKQLIHWYMGSGEYKILSKVEIMIRPKQ